MVEKHIPASTQEKRLDNSVSQTASPSKNSDAGSTIGPFEKERNALLLGRPDISLHFEEHRDDSSTKDLEIYPETTYDAKTKSIFTVTSKTDSGYGTESRISSETISHKHPYFANVPAASGNEFAGPNLNHHPGELGDHTQPYVEDVEHIANENSPMTGWSLRMQRFQRALCPICKSSPRHNKVRAFCKRGTSGSKL